MDESSDLENVVKVYQETLALLRHYSSLRFAGLSAVLLINFGSLALAARLSLNKGVVSILVLICTVLLYIFETRTNRHIGVFKSYAVELEKKIGIGAISQLPKEGRISGWLSIKILYWVLIASCLVTILAPSNLLQMGPKP